MAVTVRSARVDDAAAMGRAHVAAWQAAYPGIMPADFLASLDPADREAEWRGAMERNPEPDGFRRLVVELDGDLVGLALVAPDRAEEPGVGELFQINLHPDAWGKGAGPALLQGCVDAMAELGFDEAVLWVAQGNDRAIRFYEREGWAADGGVKSEDFGDMTVTELRYRRPLR